MLTLDWCDGRSLIAYSALISSLAIAIPAKAVKPKIMYTTNMIDLLNVVGSTTRPEKDTHSKVMNQMHYIYTNNDYLV